MPGDPGATVVTTLVWFLFSPREAAGAMGTRHSPRPLFFQGGCFDAYPGRDRGRGMRGRVRSWLFDRFGLVLGAAARSVCPLPPCGGELERGVPRTPAFAAHPPSLTLPHKGGGNRTA